MPKLGHIVFTVLALALRVAADNAFCGCQNALPSAYTPAPLPAGQTAFTSATQCQAACYAATNPAPVVTGRTNYRHSMYVRANQTCMCTDRYPQIGAQDPGAADACANPNDWDNRVVQTTFQHIGCFSAVPGPQFTSVMGPDSCHIRCATSDFAIFQIDTVNNGYKCGCGAYNANPPAATCGPNTFFIYQHSRAQASAGQTRKRRLLEQLKKKVNSRLCPNGLSACRLDPVGDLDSDSWECIDPLTELEACGGCRYGAIGEANATVGQDCTTMGATMGAVTCTKGRCVASRCKAGYVKLGDQCIRQLVSQ